MRFQDGFQAHGGLPSGADECGLRLRTGAEAERLEKGFGIGAAGGAVGLGEGDGVAMLLAGGIQTGVDHGHEGVEPHDRQQGAFGPGARIVAALEVGQLVTADQRKARGRQAGERLGDDNGRPDQPGKQRTAEAVGRFQHGRAHLEHGGLSGDVGGQRLVVERPGLAQQLQEPRVATQKKDAAHNHAQQHEAEQQGRRQHLGDIEPGLERRGRRRRGDNRVDDDGAGVRGRRADRNGTRQVRRNQHHGDHRQHRRQQGKTPHPLPQARRAGDLFGQEAGGETAGGHRDRRSQDQQGECDAVHHFSSSALSRASRSRSSSGERMALPAKAEAGRGPSTSSTRITRRSTPPRMSALAWAAS